MGAPSKGTKAAARYARAIFSLADGNKTESDALITDLTKFHGLMQENSAVVSTLTNPAFPVGQRVQVVADLAGRLELSDRARKALAVIVEADRLIALPEIIDRLNGLRLQESNLVLLKIESPAELSAEQKKRIVSQFGVLLGKPVEPVFAINRSLLGGFRAFANGKSYDGSVSSWLEGFQERNTGGL